MYWSGVNLLIKTKQMDDKYFSTRDLYLASTLMTLRFFCAKIDFSIEGDKNQPVGYFCFIETPALLDAKQKYMQGLLSVEPKAFVQAMHSLKAEVANFQRNPHSKM